MPKLQNGNSTRKISLSQIAESGNVRKDYRDIEELAQSIKTSGLLQPVRADGKLGFWNAAGIPPEEVRRVK
jgi:ParB-like chromosome segregation protein Spo0J